MSWGELVTTALLGTTRRPLTDSDAEWARSVGDDRPAADPAVRLLDLAAAHRCLDLIGSAPPVEATVPQVAPDQHHPAAPEAAVEVLDELFARPDPVMINYWLQQCVEHRRTAAPAHWTYLARSAARSSRYDRATLGRILGEAGRWFLRQNPEWRRLAADAVAGALTPLPPPTTKPARGPTPRVDELADEPDLVFAQPDPWPPELVAATWALIGSGALGPRVVSYATEVGIRMPPALYPKLTDAARYYLEAPDASPAQRRAIRHSFLALEQAAYARARIAAAFAETPITLDRVEIPHV